MLFMMMAFPFVWCMFCDPVLIHAKEEQVHGMLIGCAEWFFTAAELCKISVEVWMSPMVIRVAPTGSNASPNVRYAFNSDRICASQRTDAMCQFPTKPAGAC
jgi:hypothetical protein